MIKFNTIGTTWEVRPGYTGSTKEGHTTSYEVLEKLPRRENQPESWVKNYGWSSRWGLEGCPGRREFVS